MTLFGKFQIIFAGTPARDRGFGDGVLLGTAFGETNDQRQIARVYNNTYTNERSRAAYDTAFAQGITFGARKHEAKNENLARFAHTS